MTGGAERAGGQPRIREAQDAHGQPATGASRQEHVVLPPAVNEHVVPSRNARPDVLGPGVPSPIVAPITDKVQSPAADRVVKAALRTTETGQKGAGEIRKAISPADTILIAPPLESKALHPTLTEAERERLEQNRFVMTQESQDGIEAITTSVTELQQLYPFLRAVSFFGSRTTATDRNSDFDVCFFTDSSKASIPAPTDEKWQQIKKTIEEQTMVRLDHHIVNQAGEQRVDISKHATKKDVGTFIDSAKPIIDEPITDAIFLTIDSRATQNLISRFFLTTNDEVIQSRHEVLEILKETPQGEKYFQVLMKALGNFERNSRRLRRNPPPLYEGLPKTIAEAEAYFVPDTESGAETEAEPLSSRLPDGSSSSIELELVNPSWRFHTAREQLWGPSLPYGRTIDDAKPTIGAGFYDVLEEKFGAGSIYNTDGSVAQLAMALAVSEHPDVARIMQQGGHEMIGKLRDAQVLAGMKILDLGCGKLPSFGLTAKALGAEVHTVDAAALSEEVASRFDSHTVMDLNDPQAAQIILERTGGNFDFVGANILGLGPTAPEGLAFADGNVTKKIAEKLLADGKWFFGEVDLYQKPSQSLIEHEEKPATGKGDLVPSVLFEPGRSAHDRSQLTEAEMEKLRQHRFIITPESQFGMARIRTVSEELQETVSYYKGLGIHGSRKTGTELQDSDYDVIVYYDSSEIASSKGKLIDSRTPWNHISHSLKRAIGENVQVSLIRCDISSEATTRQLEKFIEVAKPHLDKDITQLREDSLLYQSSSVYNLVQRLFLTDSEAVIQSRSDILEALKNDTDNGEKYFQMLMQILSIRERNSRKVDLPRFEGFPKTIDEAKSFFVTDRQVEKAVTEKKDPSDFLNEAFTPLTAAFRDKVHTSGWLDRESSRMIDERTIEISHPHGKDFDRTKKLVYQDDSDILTFCPDWVTTVEWTPLALHFYGMSIHAPVGEYGELWAKRLVSAGIKLAQATYLETSDIHMRLEAKELSDTFGNVLKHTAWGRIKDGDLGTGPIRTHTESFISTTLAAGYLTMYEIEGYEGNPDKLLHDLTEQGIVSQLSLLINPRLTFELATSGGVFNKPIVEKDSEGKFSLNRDVITYFMDRRGDRVTPKSSDSKATPLERPGCPAGRKLKGQKESGVDINAKLLTETVGVQETNDQTLIWVNPNN